MRRLMQTITWFRDVSVLAEDEQRRSGHPEIDIEHLFLALLGIGGQVTESLHESGITLPTAREALSQLHARRAAQLGVHLPPTDPSTQRIPEPHTRGGFVYRDGVRVLLEEAARAKQPDTALFSALLTDPAGQVRELLRELSIDPEHLTLTTPASADAHADADADARGSSQATQEDQPGQPVHTAPITLQRFLPATSTEVWQLVSSPDRWLEWHGFECDSVHIHDSGVLAAHARAIQLNGKPSRTPAAFQTSEYVVSRFQAPHLIQWERSFPAADRPSTHSLRLEIQPQGTGTLVTLSFLHTGPTTRRSFTSSLTRPIARLLHPWMVRGYLRGKADNLSHALRQ